MTMPRPRFTFWKAVFLFIMAAGIYCTYLRFFRGLGASTEPERPVSVGAVDRL